MAESGIIPYLCYADAGAAIEFLHKAFGFEETFRVPMADGSIGHAELVCGDSTIYLASASEAWGFASPRDLPGVHCQQYCHVDDVDMQFPDPESLEPGV